MYTILLRVDIVYFTTNKLTAGLKATLQIYFLIV